MEDLERLVTYVVLTAVSLGGAYAFYALRRRLMNRSSENWPSVYGTIEQRYIDAEGRSSLAVVSYSYAVNGDYFTGFHRQAFPLEELAERFIARYPKDTKVLIRHSPSDSISVLRDQDQVALAASRGQ